MDLFGDLPDPADAKKQDSAGITSANSNNGKDAAKEVAHSNAPAISPPPKESGSEKRKPENSGDGPLAQKARLDQTHSVFKLTTFVADRKGEREEMQDSHTQIDNFSKMLDGLHPSIERVSLYAVFDGHGGARASRFASQYLPKILASKFPKGDLAAVEKEMKKCLVEVFKKLDEDFLKEAAKQKPSWKDGTTAVVVLVINNTLYIANIGDSKAILCRYKEEESKCVAIPLTTDHSPTAYAERMRIQKAGGNVREGRMMGVLEVSRSFGDGPYKNHGITCLPDVKRCQLTANDRYIMLACDGLWKSFTMEESINFVNDTLKDQAIHGTDRRTAQDVRYDTSCSRLANKAVLRLSGDNVTVLLIAVHPNSVKS